MLATTWETTESSIKAPSKDLLTQNVQLVPSHSRHQTSVITCWQAVTSPGQLNMDVDGVHVSQQEYLESHMIICQMFEGGLRRLSASERPWPQTGGGLRQHVSSTYSDVHQPWLTSFVQQMKRKTTIDIT